MPIVVSESAAEETLQAYSHPLSIQAKAISDLEKTVLNGDRVSDGNNVFTYLTEFSSNLIADIVNKACNCFNSLYPENAQSSTDLYKHLSDFDYVGLFATPAEMNVEIVFDRNFLIDNAVKCDDYYKIVIPEYSKFNVGDYVFGLMHPIEIRIRKAVIKDKDSVYGREMIDYNNCVLTVMWDTSRKNPLNNIESHVLEHREFVQEGQALTAISVPIYQFEVANHLENAIASSGFARRYDYTDKFYAVRVFHWKNGQWNEMAQTLSDINYDVDVPTAMIKVLTELGKVEVVVPQIYFNTDNLDSKIGNRILVKIYTTKGEINMDLSEFNANSIGASFLLTDTILIEDDMYSNMLKRIPTVLVIPLTSRIMSGTNGLTVEELRERVKHSASYAVKITPDDLEAYFSSSGFTFTRELDNITDRVFCAHKVITDSTGSTVASGIGATRLTPKMLDIEEDEDGRLYIPNYSSISVESPTSITILPSAIYKFDEYLNDFIMLSDSEVSKVLNVSLKDKVGIFNSGLYTFSPFHTRVSLDQALPIAGSYDLYNPSLRAITFGWENPNTTADITVYTASIKVLTPDSKKTGYRLSVALYKTNNLVNVPSVVNDVPQIKNIQVLLSTVNSRGVYEYMLGKYDGKDSSNHDVFIFDIESDFKITSDGLIDAKTFTDLSGEQENNFVDITKHQYNLDFFVKSEFITEDEPMNGVDTSLNPPELDEYVHLCKQHVQITLGGSLPLLQSNIEISTTDEKYKNYPTTEFATYMTPVYKRWTVSDFKNEVIDPTTGNPVTTDKIGMLVLAKDEETGRFRPVVAHEIGDIIINSKYDYSYGPVTTMQFGSNGTVTYELTENVSKTSRPDNVWTSIMGDVCVKSPDAPAFTGVYNLVDRTAKGHDRVWRQQHTSDKEIFDVAKLAVPADIVLYQYVDDGGHIAFSTEVPAVEEYTRIGSIGGYYYSANDEEIKEAIRISGARNDLINTSARGTDRTWYLYGLMDESFDFANHTGFAIKYNAVNVDSIGLVINWNLSYYYQYRNEETGLIELGEYTIIDNLMTSTVMSDEDKSHLTTDSYVARYQTIYNFIKFVDDGTKYGWLMSESISEDGSASADKFYARCVEEFGDYEPWEASWTSLDPYYSHTPTVTLMNTSDTCSEIRIEEALQTICEYICKNGTADATAESLNKYLDTGKPTADTTAQPGKKYYSRVETGSPICPYIYKQLDIEVGSSIPFKTYELTDMYVVDPLQSKLFACVETCKDHREQEYCNSKINYAPGIPDPWYVKTAGVTRNLEVGTSTAEGAVYYRDINAECYDLTSVTLPVFDNTNSDLFSILVSWYSHATDSESVRYKHVSDDTGMTVEFLKGIVSDTKPCFISPWKKLVTVSSFGALYGEDDSYYNNRKILNCTVRELEEVQQAVASGYQYFETLIDANIYVNTRENEDDEYAFVKSLSEDTDTWAKDALLGSTPHPSCAFVKLVGKGDTAQVVPVRAGYTEETCLEVINMYGVTSGFMYVVYTGATFDDLEPKYYNYTSKQDRRYQLNKTTVTKNELNINHEDSIWTEIDKWPWEFDKTERQHWFDVDTGEIVPVFAEFNTTLSGAKPEHMNTDVLHDKSGNPVPDIEGVRNISMNVAMIHCDYKPMLASDKEYDSYDSDIRSLLRSYFNELNSVTPSLLARTNLYFTPIKTFGNAWFKGEGTNSLRLPLEFTVDLGLHVYSYVDGSELNKDTITDNILALIDNRLKTGSINLAMLANDITNGLSDNIICVDVLGINGHATLQTMIPESKDCYPQLKQILVVDDDNTIHLKRALNISWFVIN